MLSSQDFQRLFIQSYIWTLLNYPLSVSNGMSKKIPPSNSDNFVKKSLVTAAKSILRYDNVGKDLEL